MSNTFRMQILNSFDNLSKQLLSCLFIIMTMRLFSNMIKNFNSFYVSQYLMNFTLNFIIEEIDTRHHVLVFQVFCDVVFSDMCLFLFFVVLSTTFNSIRLCLLQISNFITFIHLSMHTLT